MKQLFTPYIYIVLFLWNFAQLNAQDFILKISTKDSLKNSIIEELKFQKKHRTSQSIFTEIDSLHFKLERLGYFNNRLDSIVNKDSIYTAHFFLGKSNKRIKIFYPQNSLTKKDLFRFTKVVKEDYFEINIEETPNILNQLVEYFVQQGKSFTSVNLTNISFERNNLTAALNINTSEKRIINKVIISGYENFPKSFLKHFLDVQQNSFFSTQKIQTISKQIKALPFVSEAKPSQVLFTNDSTYLYLYLKKEKANRFDGLIGFTSNETNNNLDFNGYLDLELNNILNSGENIQLNWKNNGNNRQFFNINVELPYIFNSSITPKLGLNIYKQDSTFITNNLDFELGYVINYRNKIGLVLSSRSSSNLLNIPIDNDITDFNSIQYGARYNYQILNNSILFPIKFAIDATATFGSRSSQNISISQSQLSFKASYLWSLNFKNHLFIKNETALLNSDNYLTNELFRIGGVNSFRGFNEESIFASLYSTVNLEYRYTPNTTSYLYSISDFGLVQNQINQSNQQLYSLGLGYQFKTSFGFLNLSYAIGKFDSLPFQLNNSRFHLKILSFF